MKKIIIISLIFLTVIFVSILIFNSYGNDVHIQKWEEERQIPDISNRQVESWGYRSLNINYTKVYKRKIKIAVIDSGIDKFHPELEDIVTKEYNAINANEEIVDDTGHGTGVAGIIGAKNNGLGIRGVVDSIKVEIYSIKAFENNSSNEEIIKRALKWSIDQNVDIINFSAGASITNPELESLIAEAVDKKIIIVAAAGNKFNRNIQFPADQSNVISVGAVNHEYKQVSGTVINNVDIVGPGVNILTTYPGNTYNYLGHTSSSTAFVTGIVSNLLSQYLESSKINYNEILNILKANSKIIKLNDDSQTYFIQESNK